jgi:hypothetical protein
MRVMNDGQRHVVLVVGMHRSGTSVTTNLLSRLGAALPSRLMPAAPSNPQGHFEPGVLVALNDRLLAAIGRSWSDWRPFGDGWHQNPEAQRLAAEIAAAIHVDFGDSKLFVIKDPRLCRLLPLWSSIIEQIDCTPLFVLPYRNPVEVAHSLQARNGGDAFHWYMLWLVHLLDAEFESRKRPRVFVRYESLVENPLSELERIVACTPVCWPHGLDSVAPVLQEIAQPHLRRSRAEPGASSASLEVPAWVDQVYACYEELRTDPTNPAIMDRLDGVRRSLTDATRPFVAGHEHLARRPSDEETQRRLQTLTRQIREAQAEIARGPSHCNMTQRGNQDGDNDLATQTRLVHEQSAHITHLDAVLARSAIALEQAQSLMEARKADADQLRKQLKFAQDTISSLNGAVSAARDELAATALSKQQQAASDASRIEQLSSELDARRIALAAAVARAEEDARALAQSRAEADAGRVALGAALARTEADAKAIEQLTSELEANRTVLTSALARTETEVDRIRKAFLGSRSWRAATPLRWAARRLSRKRADPGQLS